MAENKRRPGRPGREPEVGERVGLSLRVTPETKKALELASKTHGRSLSQEAELRLEQTFRDELLLPQLLDAAYGRETAGLLMALAETIRSTSKRAGALCDGSDQAWHENPTVETVGLWLSQEWMCYPWAFRQVVDAVWTVLTKLSPPGFQDAEPPEAVKAMPGTLRGPFEFAGKSVASHVIAALRDRNAPNAGLARAVAPARERLADHLLRIGEQLDDGR